MMEVLCNNNNNNSNNYNNNKLNKYNLPNQHQINCTSHNLSHNLSNNILNLLVVVDLSTHYNSRFLNINLQILQSDTKILATKTLSARGITSQIPQI